MTVHAAGRRPLRLAVSSLGVRNYRLYFVGQTISIAGTWMQTMALAFLVLGLTGNGTDLGITTAARLLPLVLLGPLGGVLADRADKRRLLYLTQTAQAAMAVAFALLCALDAATVPLVIGLSLLVGCLTAFDNPARQALIGELVPRDQLANAVALNSVSANLARVLGAAVGGGLVAWLGLTAAFVVNAASFVAVLISLAIMRSAQLYPADRLVRARGQLREGLRYARRTPALFLPLVMLTITGTLAYEFPVSLPLMASGAFGGGAGTYGLMAAVMAVGAIAGGLATAARAGNRASTLGVTAIGWGTAILAAGLAPNLGWELVALLFVGYGSISFNSSAKTTMQLAAAPSMRGRVMALWALAWIGTTVVGGPLIGWVAQEFGSRWTLIVGGVPTILLGMVMLPALRRIDRAAAGRSAVERAARAVPE